MEYNIISSLRDFFKLEGVHYLSSLCIGKVNFVVSVAIIDSIFFSLTPSESRTPLDRDLALIRSMLIIIRLNVESIIELGSSNPLLPRIILEDTKFSEYNNFIKKNIIFDRINLDIN